MLIYFAQYIFCKKKYPESFIVCHGDYEDRAALESCNISVPKRCEQVDAKYQGKV